MFDLTLRPLKDKVFEPLCGLAPSAVTPLQLTLAAFISGLLSCYAAVVANPPLAFAFWVLNRCLDCMDGAVARRRGQASDLGGFLDLLGDFIVYSAIPICCTLGLPPTIDQAELQRRWVSVAVVESTFHVNNFVLFFIAALTEKQRAAAIQMADDKGTKHKVKELTTLSMKPALIEGAESGLIFSIMLAFPNMTELLCWLLAGGVAFGTMQRTGWLVAALGRHERTAS